MPAGAVGPHLSTGVRGAVSLSWLEPGTSGALLRVAVAGDSGWSRPRTVTQLGAQPAVAGAAVRAGPCGMYLAHWWEPAAAAGDQFRTAVSIDGAWSWTLPGGLREGPVPSDGPALATFDAFDGIGIAWQRPSGDSAVLTSAVLGGDGAELHPTLVDPAACPCCTVATTWAQSGALLGYVRRSGGGGAHGWELVLRREQRGRWDAPVTVAAMAGEGSRCPAVRVALAARHDTVAVVWVGDSGQLRLAWSFDGGRRVGAGHLLAEGARHHPVVALTDDGALVGWADSAGLAVRWAGWQGRAGPLRRISTGPGAEGTWAPVAGQLLVAWQEPGSAVPLRLARIARQPALTFTLAGRPTGALPSADALSFSREHDHAASRLPD